MVVESRVVSISAYQLSGWMIPIGEGRMQITCGLPTRSRIGVEHEVYYNDGFTARQTKQLGMLSSTQRAV